NIRNSKVLTGNHLGKLANVQEIPNVDPYFNSEYLKVISSDLTANYENQLHYYVTTLLDDNKVNEAWQALLFRESDSFNYHF
ncbi:MAG TPA: flavin reductase family protein, partial [Segetibacter sp.]